MKKKSKIDFVINESDYKETIFRFLPRQSSCHSFGDNPPTKWEEVYKVYYSYKIFTRWKNDNFTKVVFDCSCDECSIIDEVAASIKHIISGKKSITVNFHGKKYVIDLLNKEMLPHGDGVSWTINELDKDMYGIVLWGHHEVGYRFCLEKNKLREFGEYLNECCEYMLAHGDPI